MRVVQDHTSAVVPKPNTLLGRHKLRGILLVTILCHSARVIRSIASFLAKLYQHHGASQGNTEHEPEKKEEAKKTVM